MSKEQAQQDIAEEDVKESWVETQLNGFLDRLPVGYEPWQQIDALNQYVAWLQGQRGTDLNVVTALTADEYAIEIGRQNSLVYVTHQATQLKGVGKAIPLARQNLEEQLAHHLSGWKDYRDEISTLNVLVNDIAMRLYTTGEF